MLGKEIKGDLEDVFIEYNIRNQLFLKLVAFAVYFNPNLTQYGLITI